MPRDRSLGTARMFIDDLASRLSSRVQITSDNYRAYLTAIDFAFGPNIHYAVLHKIYGKAVEGPTRYSPAECIGCKRAAITGNPDPKHISTSFVERQNLSVRMSLPLNPVDECIQPQAGKPRRRRGFSITSATTSQRSTELFARPLRWLLA